MGKAVAVNKIRVENQEEYQRMLLNVPYNEILLEMKEYAKLNDVPVMQEEGIAFLVTLMKLLNPKRILEVGSAIGYSSSFMALNSDAVIDTMERDPKMILECKKNHERLGLTDRIHLIEGDALETVNQIKDNRYDFIFIDAAKAQYIKFFEEFSPLLDKNGVILTDNLYFHDLLFEEINNRDLRQLVRKVDTYNQYLLENPNFETHIFKIGDGIGISKRK